MSSTAAGAPHTGLAKSAGWVQLWALGVGAVISGNFFGWQTGLVAGGFGGLLLATLAIGVMYVCLVFSIAELSAALPHAGGFYHFTRAAFGKDAAFLNGVTDTIEYITTPAVIVAGIAGYMNAILPGPDDWVWWTAFYLLFVGINILGAALTFRVSMAVTALALITLAVFCGGVLVKGAFRWEYALRTPLDPGASPWLPHGWFGVFAALPYAVWFYLAIEQLPLSAEESYDVRRDVPRALVYGIASLLGISLLVMTLNAGVAPGAQTIGESAAPLDLGFRAVFGGKATQTLLALASLTGLVASFHAIIYAYGRLLFALGRAGYFPQVLSHVGRWRTPHTALLAGGAVGLVLCFLARQYSGSVGAALLNMAVFGALVSYVLVLCAFIRLRRHRPDLPRPYRSPLGIAGAVTGIALAALCVAGTFASPAFRPGVIGTGIFVVAMMSYYALFRRSLVKDDE